MCCGFYLAALGLDEDASEFLLEGANLLPYGGLGERKAVGGQREAFGFNDSDEAAELLESEFFEIVSLVGTHGNLGGGGGEGDGLGKMSFQQVESEFMGNRL